MTHHGKLLVCALRGGVMIALAIGASSANALTQELAKKCRNMAPHAYPHQLPGTGPGNAQNEIRFYNTASHKRDVTPPLSPSNGSGQR